LALEQAWVDEYTEKIYRRLADGNVHCAGSAIYQICFRLPIPNPVTDPNPNRNPKNNKKKKRTPE